jgi:TonB family protein
MRMKKLLSVLLLLPIITLAQKIRINEYDKFIKQQRVESHPLSIANSPDMKLSVCFSAEGSNLYLQLIGAGTGAHRIDPGDPVIFLMDNDSTITVKSRGPQGFDIGTTTTTYKHHYILTYTDLKKLSQNNLAALRKYHSLEYDDVNVPIEVSAKFKTLCALFIVELLNSNLLHLVEAKEPSKAAPQATTPSTAQVQSPDTITKTQATPAVSSINTNTTNTNNTKVQTPSKPTEPKGIAPAFPGGAEAWSAFLRRDLYPPATLGEGEARETLVQFLVAKDGSVSDFKILQSAGEEFDKELLRVLKRTPKWKPAIENGRPVAATVTQRVVFVHRDMVEK